MPTIFLIDLDRTIFNTDKHFADVCDFLDREYGVDAGLLRHNEHKLTKKPGPYSPFDDVRYSTDTEVDMEKLKDRLALELRPKAGDFIFKDAVQFIEELKKRGHIIALITVGTQEYQIQKVMLSPLLIGLPLIITQDTKAKEINDRVDIIDSKHLSITIHGEKISGDKLILIDDRSGTFTEELPKSELIEYVRIRRANVIHSEEPTPEGVLEIKLLTEFLNSSKFASEL